MTLAPIDLDDVDDLPDDNGVQIYIRDGKPGPRWEPDLHIVDAVLSMPKASRSLKELELPDRCWLVAGLTVAGCTAENIAERCRCSVRLVRAVRAEPMTQLCEVMHREVRQKEADLRTERIDHAETKHSLDNERRQAIRFRTQRDQVLKAQRSGKKVEQFPCGCPKLEHNVYRSRGREWCRECGRARLQRWRQKNRNY